MASLHSAPIRTILQELESEPDATTNYKRRVLEEHLPKLPSELTRAQAEALLRCFDCLVRRPAILKEVLRPKLVKRGDVQAWADAFDSATTAEIAMLCGGE